MTEQEAIEQLKWLMQEHPTISRDNDFVEPLQSAISALEKQIAVSRTIVEGKYFCPKCNNLMPHPGYCECGQKVY